MANLSEKSPKKGNPKSQSSTASKSSLLLTFKASSAVKKPSSKAASHVKKLASKASLAVQKRAAKPSSAIKKEFENQTVRFDKMTIRCRPKTLANLVKDLSVDKRQAVEDIGFGGLLHLKPINIPRPILPLVLDAFGKGDHYFAIEENKSFLLSKYDVCDCFQLPTGPEPLQLLGTSRCKESTQSEVIKMKRVFKARFGILDVLKGVPSGLLESRLRSPDIGIEEFKELFVLFSVSTFLAPTSNGSIDLALLRAVQDVGRISSFDWCSYVFQSTVDAFKNFVDGARTLTGCIPFVLTSYFHRFNYKGEVMASELPLIKHWDDDRLEARSKSESKAGALGRAPVSDVPYPLSSKADYSSKTCGYTKQLVLDLPLEMDDDEDIKSKAIDEMKEIVERGELLDKRKKRVDGQTRRLEEQEKGINKWSKEVRFKETELGKRKRVIDEQIRGLEEREKELNEWGNELGFREKEILEGGTKLEEKKKALDGEKGGLEEREKELNEWAKGLGLKEKEILEGGKQLEERKKALDGESLDAEVKRMEAEEREKKIKERENELGMKEEELCDLRKNLELKEKDIDKVYRECCEELSVKKDALLEQRKSLKLKEIEIDEQRKEVELKQLRLDEQLKGKEISRNEKTVLKVNDCHPSVVVKREQVEGWCNAVELEEERIRICNAVQIHKHKKKRKSSPETSLTQNKHARSSSREQNVPRTRSSSRGQNNAHRTPERNHAALPVVSPDS